VDQHVHVPLEQVADERRQPALVDLVGGDDEVAVGPQGGVLDRRRPVLAGRDHRLAGDVDRRPDAIGDPFQPGRRVRRRPALDPVGERRRVLAGPRLGRRLESRRSAVASASSSTTSRRTTFPASWAAASRPARSALAFAPSSRIGTST
jgi:hypothetical protein